MAERSSINRGYDWHVGYGALDQTGGACLTTDPISGAPVVPSSWGGRVDLINGNSAGVVLVANPIEFDRKPAVVCDIEGSVAFLDAASALGASVAFSLQKVRFNRVTGKYCVRSALDPNSFNCGGPGEVVWAEGKTFYPAGDAVSHFVSKLHVYPTLPGPVELHSEDALVMFVEYEVNESTLSETQSLSFAFFLRSLVHWPQ